MSDIAGVLERELGRDAIVGPGDERLEDYARDESPLPERFAPECAALCTTTAEVDRQFEVQGVKCVVDEMSLMYLVGTEIDYVEGLQGAGFKFNNPNVKSTCGCGSSFSV